MTNPLRTAAARELPLDYHEGSTLRIRTSTDAKIGQQSGPIGATVVGQLTLVREML